MASGTTAYLRAVWGSGPTDIFAVGYLGSVLHFDGKAWTAMVHKAGTNKLTGVWGAGASGDVWVVGERGAVLRYNRAAKTWTGASIETSGSLNGIWGSGPGDIYSVGWRRYPNNFRTAWRVYIFTGKAWNVSLDPGGVTLNNHLRGVWGSGPGEVVAAGTRTVVYQTAGKWYLVNIGQLDMRAVWGGPGRALVVGNNGAAGWLANGTWTPVTSGTSSNLHGVWGASAKEIYMVGASGTALLHDGSSFKKLCTGSSAHLWGIWGTGKEVFAVGDHGTILRYQKP